jgi:hypothetical protein
MFHNERCCCGASIELAGFSSDAKEITAQVAAFHKAHKKCIERKKVILKDMSIEQLARLLKEAGIDLE